MRTTWRGPVDAPPVLGQRCPTPSSPLDAAAAPRIPWETQPQTRARAPPHTAAVSPNLSEHRPSNFEHAPHQRLRSGPRISRAFQRGNMTNRNIDPLRAAPSAKPRQPSTDEAAAEINLAAGESRDASSIPGYRPTPANIASWRGSTPIAACGEWRVHVSQFYVPPLVTPPQPSWVDGAYYGGDAGEVMLEAQRNRLPWLAAIMVSSRSQAIGLAVEVVEEEIQTLTFYLANPSHSWERSDAPPDVCAAFGQVRDLIGSTIIEMWRRSKRVSD